AQSIGEALGFQAHGTYLDMDPIAVGADLRHRGYAMRYRLRLPAGANWSDVTCQLDFKDMEEVQLLINCTLMRQGVVVGASEVLSGKELWKPVFALMGRGNSSATTASTTPEPNHNVTMLHTITSYIVIGFRHILPLGLDHILFVLGLCLLARSWRGLLVQITAFTCAHTITLGLAAAGIIHVSSAIVEPLIALSIAVVAIENLCQRDVRWWRWVIVFCFGLLHGLGFAGALGELGLPEGRFVCALISFNVGVELGQITVVTAFMLAFWWWRERAWYRPAVVWPGSIAIAVMGLWWTVTRIFD
ncbi:MAG: HupE/UreJ family protein, partial [Planctomycetota bacterium]